MPTVSKQAATGNGPTASQAGGILSRIRPVKARQGGVKMCVYGRGKTGKTRLACTFPKPVLILGTEDGTASVSTVKDVFFAPIASSADVGVVVEELAGGKYKTVALDTAGGLQDLILKEVLGLDQLPVQRTWGMARREDWMTCGAQCKERLRQLLDLADRCGTNVVVIAHERNFNDDGNVSDVMLPSVGAALSPSVAGWLNGACDYICQTFIREQVGKVKSQVAGKEVEMVQPTGRKEYCLRTGPHSVFMTGFRLPEGTALPDVVTDPSYDKIAKLIRGG